MLVVEGPSYQRRSHEETLAFHQRDGIPEAGMGELLSGDDLQERRQLLWLLEPRTFEISAAGCRMALRRRPVLPPWSTPLHHLG